MTSPSSPALRVATYNVLAQVYAKSSWFPWTERRLMKSKTRRDAIRTYIEKLNVDVLALQEVDGYEDDEENAKSGGGWKTWLASRGYESTYVRRTNVSNAKKDGSCVAWRRDVLEEIERREIVYNDIANEMYPSTSETADGDDDAATVEARSRYLRDCVGNLTLLRRRATDEEIVFASTHLYWDPAFADVKLSQAKKLIEECRRFRADRERATNGVNKVRVVVCGDFNSVETSDVYREMNAAFPSVSADAEPAHTNVTPNFTATIDYIFVSDGVRVVSVQEQPARRALGEGLPNADHPSDHLPVVAELAFD